MKGNATAAHFAKKKDSKINKNQRKENQTRDAVLEQNDQLHLLLTKYHALAHVARAAALKQIPEGVLHNYFNELVCLAEKALKLHNEIQEHLSKHF